MSYCLPYVVTSITSKQSGLTIRILIQSVKQQRRAPEPYRPYASRQLPLGHRADVARNRGDSPYHVSSASERRYSGDGSVGDGAGRRQEGEGEEGEGGEGIDPEMVSALHLS